MTSPQDPFAPPPGGQPPQPPSQPYEPAPAYGQQPAPAYGQPYGQPAYGTGPQGAPRNGLGIAALVLGIVGIVTSWLFVGGLLGIGAIVLGAIGRGRAKRGEATNGGMALAGILTGVVAVLFAALVVVGAIALFSNSDVGSFTECIQQAETQADADQCAVDFEDSITTG